MDEKLTLAHFIIFIEHYSIFGVNDLTKLALSYQDFSSGQTKRLSTL
jgi:hypothetical protein